MDAAGEGDMAVGRTAQVDREGIGELVGIEVRRRPAHVDLVAFADWHTRDLGIGDCVAHATGEHGVLEARQLLDRARKAG